MLNLVPPVSHSTHLNLELRRHARQNEAEFIFFDSNFCRFKFASCLLARLGILFIAPQGRYREVRITCDTTLKSAAVYPAPPPLEVLPRESTSLHSKFLLEFDAKD